MPGIRLIFTIGLFLLKWLPLQSQVVYKSTSTVGEEEELIWFLSLNTDSTFVLVDEKNDLRVLGDYCMKDSSFFLMPETYIKCDSTKKGFFDPKFVFLDIRVPYLDLGNQNRVRVGNQSYRKNSDGIYVIPKDSISEDYVGIGGYCEGMLLDKVPQSDYYYLTLKLENKISNLCLNYKSELRIKSSNHLVLKTWNFFDALGTIYFSNRTDELIFEKIEKGTKYVSVIK
jgi:hypothetical protein